MIIYEKDEVWENSFEVEEDFLIVRNLNFEITSEIDEILETLIGNKNYDLYKDENYVIGKIPKKIKEAKEKKIIYLCVIFGNDNSEIRKSKKLYYKKWRIWK